jgi:Tfp pilus assembly protein PilE
VFLHLNDKQVSEFCAQWKEINNWLDKFLPVEPNQHFPDDQVKEILYSIIPKCWQSYLHRDKFNMTKASVNDFFDFMERYQITDSIDPLLKPKDQSKIDKDDNKKSMEKLNDKKRKAQTKKDDAPAPKKSCLLHGPDSSHTTNECQTICEQAYGMKEAYKNISPAERSRQKCEREQQKKKEQNKLHEMIMKEVQQTMQTMFKQPHQHHCSDDDSNI